MQWYLEPVLTDAPIQDPSILMSPLPPKKPYEGIISEEPPTVPDTGTRECPSGNISILPELFPTGIPSEAPTSVPTSNPSSSPSGYPLCFPTEIPTQGCT